MANVLPENIKKNNQKEYGLRFWALVLAAFATLFIFAGILLIPSYVISVTEEEGKIEQIKQVKAYSASRADDAREQAFERTKAELRLIKSEKEPVVLKEVINEILDAHSNTVGISIANIHYEERHSQEGLELYLAIRGVSDTRDDLLDLKQELGRSDLFENVELPVSSLRDERNLRFSITLGISN